MLTELVLAATLVVAAPALVSKQEKLAHDIETRVQAGTDGLTPAWDSDAFLAKVTEGSDDFNPEFKKGFSKGYRSKENSLGESIVGTVKQGGRFTLMRVREVGGQTKVLYRLLMPGGGVSYFELLMSAVPKVVDVYIFTSGELLSETIRRLYLQTAAEASQGLLDKLKGKEQLLLKNVPTLTAMQKALAAKEHAKVLELYKSLPESLKKEKIFLSARMQAALEVDDEEYVKAIDDFRAAFANDPASDLMAIDGFFLRKKYDLAIGAIDRLEKTVGGDAYLKFMRGSMLAAWGKAAESKATMMEAIKTEPSLVEPYWALVEASLNVKKFDETAKWLTAIEKETTTRIDDLSKVEVYAGFVKSPHYKKWRAAKLKTSNR
jgi:tetratricopeptide (TPR) repeat protein